MHKRVLIAYHFMVLGLNPQDAINVYYGSFEASLKVGKIKDEDYVKNCIALDVY